MSLAVKICGVRTPEAVQAAIAGGARWIGLNFHPASPRAVEPLVAAELVRLLPTGVRAVGLFVDPTDVTLGAVLPRVPLDMIQLHGTETPERVAAIRADWGLPVMKAIPVREAADLAAVARYAPVADWLLFDAKPPPGVAALPGGNGIPFDWTLLQGMDPGRPWMLAGGLAPSNLAEAVRAAGATAVDVSSGVESRPGVKEPQLVRAFLAQAEALSRRAVD